MSIGIRQQLKLTQQLVMTPQLQQAIKLLQLSRLELTEVIHQELQENPCLEEVAEAEEAELPREVAAEVEAPEVETAEAPPENREPTDAEKIADIDWQNYMDAYPQTGLAGGRDEGERRSLEATLTRAPSLADHLLWQLHLSHFDAEERRAAAEIIGNLDENGYLAAELPEIAEGAGVPLAVVERALGKVQTFDPTGVAARDLRECLLLQARALGIEDELVHRILEEQMERLQKRDFRGIARALGVGVEEVAAAARVIGRLEPRPGRAFGGEEPVYITPDIYVYKVGEDYHILLNEDGLPKLRVSQLYREVVSGDGEGGSEARAYVQEKLRSAVWLIKSIHQRQRTIYKVMRSILKHQREFFDKGIQHLRPLNLRDVAEDIEMHESTVSRVTTNKYVHTPQGIFELKFFFNSSISRVNGEEALSSQSVKEKIRRIIAAEDPRRPLSDQRIAEMLKAAGIDIARRTVTKYRESMNILSSTKRRQVG